MFWRRKGVKVEEPFDTVVGVSEFDKGQVKKAVREELGSDVKVEVLSIEVVEEIEGDVPVEGWYGDHHTVVDYQKATVGYRVRVRGTKQWYKK
jgi:hypothetical protein